jgi:glycosyltransferase involved in cell wall biosynthesis
MTPSGVAELWADHDVFVLPSRFEAYGLALLEARAAGLPCIARREFAMPELVPEGRAGTLVPADGGVDEVADAIDAVSRDGDLFAQVAADADEVARENSWSAVAGRILDVTRRTVGVAAPSGSGTSGPRPFPSRTLSQHGSRLLTLG